MDWYKIYQGLPTDPKLAVVAKRTGLSRAETLALWILLHDYASRQLPRGSLDGLDAEDTATLLDLDTDKTAQALDIFYDKGMISIDNHIAHWAKSQHKSTDRVRAWRQRQKETTPQTHTQSPDLPASSRPPHT
jgi:hypothetical protein